jgi:hypothetical protein
VSEIPPFEPTPPPPAPASEPLPWEAPNAGIGSIVPTAIQFIASPIRAFERMNLTVDLVRPIAYFVALILVAAVVAQVWNAVLWDTLMGVVKGFLPPQMNSLLHRPSALQIALGLIMTPLVYLILLFVWSGVVHLILTMLGGAAGGFAATLRTICYARTSDVATLIPLVGGLIGFVWGRVLEIIGLSAAHRTEGWKAALAVFIPLLLCCLCVVGAGVLFGAGLAQFLQQMK